MNETLLPRLIALSRSLSDIILELSMTPQAPPTPPATPGIQALLEAAKGNPELEKLITRRAAAANVAARYDDKVELPTASRVVRSKISFGSDPGVPWPSTPSPTPPNGTAAEAAGVSDGK